MKPKIFSFEISYHNFWMHKNIASNHYHEVIVHRATGEDEKGAILNQKHNYYHNPSASTLARVLRVTGFKA